ncbi:MAG: phosphate/phosphite/phosphonate ABC transporter substrate-binding protein [Gammaproteobacteria bacterium]|nr:phosphate/phosphite/phosphonate ABC transporter substrate-binding protein [Gammaproteobacteria bacterium]
MLLFTLFLLTACDSQSDKVKGPVYQTKKDHNTNTKTNYHLAVHPLHNPRKLSEAYQPLIDYLNKNLNNVHIELEASRDYQAYEVKFRARLPELILPNPWQTLEAIKVGYNAIAMAGDAEDFKGIFIVRKDSGIEEPTDLIGKVVSYPSPTALAACIMPQRFLHDNGVDVIKNITNRYVGSQESSIMNVYLEDSAAGATWPPPWRLFQRDRPKEAAQLKVIWETPPLMNNSLMVRDDIAPALTAKIQTLLVKLHEDEEGQKILNGMATSRFYKANNDSYIPVKKFVEQFEQDVRSVE